MTPAKLDRLKQIQDQAIDHAIEEMDAASTLTLKTKEERGDRAWLTGMCSKSLSVAYRVQQFLEVCERGDLGFDHREEEEQERAAAEFVKRAEAQMRSIIERGRPKFKHGLKG